MAYIYNLTDTWSDTLVAWNGIKLVVTNTGSSSGSNLLNLTVTGATSGSFIVDKNANLNLTGSITLAGTGSTTLVAPNSAGSFTFRFPSTEGTSGFVLTTDGAGNTSWGPPGNIANITVGSSFVLSGSNRYLLYNNNGVLGNANLQFDGANLGVGITPKAFTLPAIESTYGLFSGRSVVNILQNAYYGTNFQYSASSVAASRLYLNAGGATFYTAPSGTADGLISWTPTLQIDATTGTTNTVLGQPQNSTFWSLLALTNSMNRIGGRLFVGAACTNSGDFVLGPAPTYTPYGSTVKDWLDAYEGSLTAVPGYRTCMSQLASLSKNGAIGVLGGTRTSDNTTFNQAQFALAVVGEGINDNTTSQQSCGGVYGVGFRQPDAGVGMVTAGAEFSIANLDGTRIDQITPYQFLPATGATLGMIISGGAAASNLGTPVYTAGAGLVILNNAANFNAGIVIDRTAINGTDGTTGTGSAIRMGNRQQIEWWKDNTAPCFVINSVMATASKAQGIFATDGGIWFGDRTYTYPQFLAGYVANPRDYVATYPSTATTSVLIKTLGGNNDILSIGTGGTGAIQLFTNGEANVKAVLDNAGKFWLNTSSTITSQYFYFGNGTTAQAGVGGYYDNATSGHLEFYTRTGSALVEQVRIPADGGIQINGSTSGSITLLAGATPTTYTITLPSAAAAGNGYILTSTTGGVTSWTNPTALGIDLDVGSTVITGGSTGRVLYNNSGVLGEYSTVPLASGGTNANLTASNGGIIYSTASAMAVLSGTATAGQMLRSGASGAPSWSTATFPATATSAGTILRADGTNWVATTATYPTTTTINRILYSSSSNTIGEISTTNGGILNANSSGVPSMTVTPTLGVAGTSAGTIGLSGATSGVVTLQTAAAAGTWSLTLPTTGGTNKYALTTNGSGVSSWSQIDLAAAVTGTLPVANGGTGTATAFTTGSVVYAGASGVYAQDNTNLLFDATNYDLTVGGSVKMGTSFLRNRLINGCMAVDQRNLGAAQTFTAAAALAYAVDRWYGYCTGANVTGQRVAGTAPSQYAYKFTGATSNTAVGFGQRIEQLNSYDLASGAVTISAYMTASTNTTITWYLYTPTTTADTFGTLASPTVTQIATGTFSVTTSRTRFTATIAAATMAGNNKGLELRFVAASGLGNAVTWTIEDVQLEAGTIATAVERRPYGSEFLLCQRYLPAINTDGVNGWMIGNGFYATTTVARAQIVFQVPARVKPTGTTITNPANFTVNGTANSTVSSAAFNGASTTVGQVDFIIPAVANAFYGCQVYGNGTGTAQILFTGCEL